jgi:hypothetical protein
VKSGTRINENFAQSFISENLSVGLMSTDLMERLVERLKCEAPLYNRRPRFFKESFFESNL